MYTNVFLFRYYLYEGLTFRAGPFSIHEDAAMYPESSKYHLLNMAFLPRSVRSIDAAMLFRNGRLYFFAGQKFEMLSLIFSANRIEDVLSLHRETFQCTF